MKRVDFSTYQRSLEILTHAFRDVPGVRWVVKDDHNVASRIRALCNHCLCISHSKKGAYITSDSKGVALIFSSRQKANPLLVLRSYFFLGQRAISWSRALDMIKRERHIRSFRPKSEYLYFWMMAVEDNANGIKTIQEIRDFAFQLSHQQQLPIYAETTTEATLKMYLRYGFQHYATWEEIPSKRCIYFLKREPH